MGRAHERRFVNVHRILNRAAWCPRSGSRILLGRPIAAFAPHGPVVLGLDDTIERRRGKRIAARGIYRDPDPQEATVKRSHYISCDQLRDRLATFPDAYNFARRLKTLRGLTPYEVICRVWADDPDHFRYDPAHLTAGLNTGGVGW